MPEINEVAEWLGVEVIDVEGEYVLRYRQQTGKWCEREQRATTEEVVLYDALRGMVATQAQSAHALLLKSVAHAVGLGEETRPMRVLAEISALRTSLADHKKALEKQADHVLSLRRQLRDLANAPRVTPKGGDRNELARQIRRTAQQRAVADEARGVEFCKGVTAMANTVLLLMGEPPLHHTAGKEVERVEVPPGEQWLLRQELAERIGVLKSERYVQRIPGSRAETRQAGEQEAYEAIIAFLVGEEKT